MAFQELSRHRRFDPQKYRKCALFETPRSALDLYCLLPGQAQKVHSHDATDKYYVVLEGRVVVTVGDEERECGPGWAALAPPGVAHGVRNASDSPAVVLVAQAPKPW